MSGFTGLSKTEQLFLDALFDKARNPDNDFEIAKEIAGYSPEVSVVQILRNIKTCLQEDVQSYLLSKSMKAVKVIEEIMTSENPLPNSDKVLRAAEGILDRAGITKKDKSEITVKVPDGVVILPPIKMPIE